jgi:hypothetical protein
MGFSELYLLLLLLFVWSKWLSTRRPEWVTARWLPWAVTAPVALAAVAAATALSAGMARGAGHTGADPLRMWEVARLVAWFLTVSGCIYAGGLTGVHFMRRDEA